MHFTVFNNKYKNKNKFTFFYSENVFIEQDKLVVISHRSRSRIKYIEYLSSVLFIKKKISIKQIKYKNINNIGVSYAIKIYLKNNNIRNV